MIRNVIFADILTSSMSVEFKYAQMLHYYVIAVQSELKNPGDIDKAFEVFIAEMATETRFK